MNINEKAVDTEKINETIKMKERRQLQEYNNSNEKNK